MENFNFETKKHYWIQTHKQQSRHNCMLLNNALMNLRGNWSKQQQQPQKLLKTKRKRKPENFAALVTAESETEE